MKSKAKFKLTSKVEKKDCSKNIFDCYIQKVNSLYILNNQKCVDDSKEYEIIRIKSLYYRHKIYENYINMLKMEHANNLQISNSKREIINKNKSKMKEVKNKKIKQK